jgi:hypothetical protein
LRFGYVLTNLEVWKFGDIRRLEVWKVWKFGSLKVWKFGSLKVGKFGSLEFGIWNF